jgi:probable F420-dependent oxidoreductase
MASAANALTEAFPERFLLGLGVSHHNLVEGLRGHRYEKPLGAMKAYLDALDAAPYQGFRPTTPVHRVLAALRPKMLELAASRAEGAHPYLTTPEHTARAREAMGPDALLCPEVKVLLDTDPASARDRLRRTLKNYTSLPNYQANLRTLGFDDTDFVDGGSDRLVDAVCVWGTVEQVVDRVQAHLDAGADHVCVQALGNQPRDVPLDEWRELAPALTSLRA